MRTFIFISALLIFIFMVFYLYAVFGEELKVNIQTIPVYCDNCGKQLQIYHNLTEQKYCDECFNFIRESVLEILKTDEGKKVFKENIIEILKTDEGKRILKELNKKNDR